MYRILMLILLAGCGSQTGTWDITHQVDCISKGAWTNNILEQRYVPEVKRCEDMLIVCMKSCKNSSYTIKCENDHDDAIAYCSTLEGFPK